MRTIIGFICGALAIVAFFVMVGIAGTVDCDTVTLAEATPKLIVWLVVMIIGGIGIKATGFDEVDSTI